MIITWLRRHEWTLVGCLAAIAFVLGAIGMRSQLTAAGIASTWADAGYFSLRLFGFEFDLDGDNGAPYAVMNVPLEVARFLAPATLMYAVMKGLMLAVAYRFNIWCISRWRGHAVICGAGERGRQLALALRADGHRVAVIETDANATTLADLRETGVRVIVGSAIDSSCQAEASLTHAEIVVAVTPCQESNLQVVLSASQRHTKRPLRALAHASRSFAEMFETQPPFNRIIAGKECSFFDHDLAASRVLVGQYAPPLVPSLFAQRREARLLLVGDGDLLPELLGIVVTQFQFAGSAPPRIDLAIVDSDVFAREFPLRHPQLHLVTDLAVHILTLPQLLRLEVVSLRADTARLPYDLVFAACREDTDTLSLARNLAQQSQVISGSIIAGLRPSTSLMRLFIDRQPLLGIHAHDLVALGCSAEIVLQGRLDQVARTIHEKYLADQLASGQPLGSSPALVPWDELPGILRQANRSQADHIPIKRQTLALSQSGTTIELLAMAEHRRWMADKIVSGWRYSPIRDDQRRLHPSIRPYEELTELERQKDRNAVMAVATE